MAMMRLSAFRATRLLRQAAAPPAVPSKGGDAPAPPPAKEFDWGGVDNVVFSEEGKKELERLRFAIKDVTNTIESKFVHERRTVNWEHFKKDLGPAIVEQFEDALKNMELPKFEDTETAELRKKFEGYEKMEEEYYEQLKKDIEAAKVEQERRQYLKARLRTMTINDVLDIYPEWRKEIDEEIRNLDWGFPK